MKKTKLEEWIWSEWEAIVWASDNNIAGMSREEYLTVARARADKWERLLDQAIDGEQWRVGTFTADALSISRWHNAMALQQYGRAEEVLETALRHPQLRHPHDRKELQWRLCITRLVLGRQEDAAAAMLEIVRQDRSRGLFLVRESRYFLVLVLKELPGNPASPSLRLLALTMARRLKQPKATLMEIKLSQTWGEVGQALDQASKP